MAFKKFELHAFSHKINFLEIPTKSTLKFTLNENLVVDNSKSVFYSLNY